jgi:hypothetical protein
MVKAPTQGEMVFEIHIQVNLLIRINPIFYYLVQMIFYGYLPHLVVCKSKPFVDNSGVA